MQTKVDRYYKCFRWLISWSRRNATTAVALAVIVQVFILRQCPVAAGVTDRVQQGGYDEHRLPRGADRVRLRLRRLPRRRHVDRGRQELLHVFRPAQARRRLHRQVRIQVRLVYCTTVWLGDNNMCCHNISTKSCTYKG